MLIGNKVDLQEERQVMYDEGAKLAKEHSVYFMETSAKEFTKVDDVFWFLATEVSRKYSNFNKPKENRSVEGFKLSSAIKDNKSNYSKSKNRKEGKESWW